MTSQYKELQAMCRPEENDTDDSVPSTIDSDDAEDLLVDDETVESRSALGVFLAALIAESRCSSATSSLSAASSPLPDNPIRIVEDRANALHRRHSLSFRRARRTVHRQRRREHAIDAKRVSRWESYPRSQNHKEDSCMFGSLPQRRLSPSPASSEPLECHYQERDSSHGEPAPTVSVAQQQPSEPSDNTFTLCSTWLDVVARNAAFSPKPAPKSLVKVRPSSPADVEGVARIPRKVSGDAASVAASLRAKRAAALSGAPRRPQRQASLTNVIRGSLSVEERKPRSPEGAEDNHIRHHVHYHQRLDRQRQRRHSDPEAKAVIQEVIRGDCPRSNSVEAKSRAHKVDDDDCSIESFQDATSAEWKQIGARSA